MLKMTRTPTYLLLAVGLAFQTCGQTTKSGEDFTIDPDIEHEAEKYISPLGANELDTLGLIYSNQLKWDLFEEGKLVHSTKDTTASMPFKAFYYWTSDSLHIDGGFGIFTTLGFAVTICDNKATVKHLLSVDEFPIYKLYETDSLQLRIDVPCNNTKLTLTALPNMYESEPVYGLVEFESEDFYEEGNDGIKKFRSNMIIYFRAIKVDF